MVFLNLSKRNIKNHKTDYIYVVSLLALVIFFISDALTKILDIKISIYSRVLFEFLFIIYLIKYLNYKKYKYLTILILLFSTMFIGLFILIIHGNTFPTFSIMFQFSVFNKMIFIFLIFLFLSDLKKIYIEKLIKIFTYLILINSIIIILSYIGDIKVFSSYGESGRFGYSGIINATNEASYFIIIGLSLLYYQFRFLNKNTIKFIFVLLSTFVVGTKAVYMFLILLFLFDFIYFFRIKKTFYLIFTIFLIFYFFLSEIILALEDNFQYILSFYDRLSLFSFLISSRDILFQTRFDLLTHSWTDLNIIFGGSDLKAYYFEMDMIDVFVIFGLPFGFLYFYLYFNAFYIQHTFAKFIVLVLFGLAMLGGHFFGSAVNALYLVLFVLYIKKMEFIT